MLLPKEDEAANALINLFHDNLLNALGHMDAFFADGDAEALHQYRVNIRKIRSVLKEYRKCMDEDIYLLLKTGLKNLVTHTNELRDLDVFLENIKEYRVMLPKKLQKNLLKIEQTLLEKRGRLFEDTKKEFISAGYQKSLYVVNDLIKEQKFYTDHAKNNICTVSKSVVKNRVKDIKKKSDSITKNSKASDFHEIRLSIKKLRYVIDGFKDFCQEKKPQAILKELKSLQELFGGVQDRELQIMRMRDYFHDDSSFLELLISILEKESQKRREKSCKKLKKLLSLDIQKVIFC